MLLEALKGENRSRPPIWLMRQAGRYMPSYQKLRARYSLRDLFFTPELAAEITLMPVEQLGVDAAILFSDITVVALSLGYTLDFSEGPVIQGRLQPVGLEPLEPIRKTIELLKPELKVPLIGFCGGPFTVASYIDSDPALLEPITQITLDYLKMQEKAGVDAIQIFDSWADQLTPEQFRAYTPYLERLVDAVQVPVIFFMRKAHLYLQELKSLKLSAISFGPEIPLATLRKTLSLPLQGNLDPDLLFQPLPLIRQKTEELIRSMKNDPGFILNLGHGVKPKTPFEAVRHLIDSAKMGMSS
jgi:uroporphyrinogen decarboxylase